MDHENQNWLFSLDERENFDDLYRLMENTVINGIHLTSMGRWKWGAQNNEHLCMVSFTVGAETSVTSF